MVTVGGKNDVFEALYVCRVLAAKLCCFHDYRLCKISMSLNVFIYVSLRCGKADTRRVVCMFVNVSPVYCIRLCVYIV